MGQYIGARYVPRFMGTYDVTQNYEALDVVDNGLGTSYISKIPTPAGTPLTDTTYWAIYGASSGAIINLQNQIGDLTDLDTTDKDSLVDAINENVSDIQALSNNTDFINKKYIFISDSYGNYTNADGKNMIEYACEKYGITNYEDIHVGNTGFGTVGTNYATMLSGATSPECDIIVAIGQANDMSRTIPEISSGFASFNTVKNTKYPNAKVIVLSMSTSFVNSEFANSKETIAEYQYECAQYGYDYYNAIYTLAFNTEFISDLVHPTQGSVNKLGRCLASILANNKPLSGEVFTETATVGAYFTNPTVTHGSLSMCSNPTDVNFISKETAIDYENTIAVTGDSRTVGTIITDLFRTVHSNLRSGLNGKYGYKIPVEVVLLGANVYCHGFLYVSDITNTYAKWSVLVFNSTATNGVTGVVIYL